MLSIKKVFYLGVSGILAFLPALVLACPMCKEAFNDTPEGAGFAKGIYYSVVLILGIFFSLVGILITYIVRQAHRTPSSWLRQQEDLKKSSI